MTASSKIDSNQPAQTSGLAAERRQVPNRLRIHGIDHVELYVADAAATASSYPTALGFSLIAEAGPETGASNRRSFTLEQGGIRLVFTSALAGKGPVSSHVARHGDGVRDVAFRVSDARLAFESAVRCGAIAVLEPTTYDGPDGKVTRATVATFGDTVHSFVESECDGMRVSPWHLAAHSASATSLGLITIDHFAACVPMGELLCWSAFYTDVLGFVAGQRFDVRTKRSGGMRLLVVELPGREVRCTLVEPLSASDCTQVSTFLDAYGSPGVQHLAFASEDIVRTVKLMGANSLPCITQPSRYYDALHSRVGPLDGRIGSLRELNILAGRDEEGYLLQAFTNPLQDRTTFFLEIIERRGTFGFAPENIRALFAAVERQQQQYTGRHNALALTANPPWPLTRIP